MIEIKFEAGLHSTYAVQFIPNELGGLWAAKAEIGEIHWSATTNEWMTLRSVALQKFGVYSSEFAMIEKILEQLVASRKALAPFMNQ